LAWKRGGREEERKGLVEKIIPVTGKGPRGGATKPDCQGKPLAAVPLVQIVRGKGKRSADDKYRVGKEGTKRRGAQSEGGGRGGGGVVESERGRGR